MPGFPSLCRDLFLLAQLPLPEGGADRGRSWERRVADHLTNRGVPVEAVPGGCRIFGYSSLSGLPHQIDSTFACSGALVVGEWKAHRAAVPKNAILRFRAATEDYYTAMAGAVPERPIMRVFGGTGSISFESRAYAAMHGITVVDPVLWPAPLLASTGLCWPSAARQIPEADRRVLAWLCRPLQQVLRPLRGGRFLMPPSPPPSAARSAIELHDYWSGQLWDAAESEPAWLEALLLASGGVAV